MRRPNVKVKVYREEAGVRVNATAYFRLFLVVDDRAYRWLPRPAACEAVRAWARRNAPKSSPCRDAALGDVRNTSLRVQDAEFFYASLGWLPLEDPAHQVWIGLVCRGFEAAPRSLWFWNDPDVLKILASDLAAL